VGRPRFSVSFADDIGRQPTSGQYGVSRNVSGNAVGRMSLARTDYLRLVELPSLARARQKHAISELSAPPTKPVDDIDADWAGNVLKVIACHSVSFISSSSSRFSNFADFESHR
jgi:hypothetical protein